MPYTPIPSPVGTSIADTWKLEAATDLGLPPSELVFFVSGDVQGAFSSSNLANGGTRAPASDANGLRISAGGAANGTAFLRFDNMSTVGAPIQAVAGATSKWWLKARVAMNSGAGGPVGAATVIGGVIKSAAAINGSHELVMGVNGAVSTTNFIVTATAGATIDSGLAIDSTVRDHKVWRDGSNTYYRIDSRSPVVGTARPNASGYGAVMAFDTAAVNQVCDVYVSGIAFPVRALGA